jgi:hypothetical protein
MQTHAALPVVTSVSDGNARVLVGGRDKQGRGQSGFVDLSIRDARVVAVAPDPVELESWVRSTIVAPSRRA